MICTNKSDKLIDNFGKASTWTQFQEFNENIGFYHQQHRIAVQTNQQKINTSVNFVNVLSADFTLNSGRILCLCNFLSLSLSIGWQLNQYWPWKAHCFIGSVLLMRVQTESHSLNLKICGSDRILLWIKSSLSTH